MKNSESHAIAYQSQPTAAGSAISKREVSAEFQNGGIAIATIIALTLLIRSIASLVKACKS